MKITVYGPGCARCKQLYANAEAALAQASVEAELEKVEDLVAMGKAGVMRTPALAIDGHVKASGKVLTPDEIRALL